MYETWYEGCMQLIRRWLVNPIEFFPQFPSLSNLTRGFLMEAYIRVRLTHFKDRLYGHYKEHARYFRELARTMDDGAVAFGEAPRGRMQTTCRA